MTTVRLMLASGSGRLVRRTSVVLFDPTGENQELTERFVAADSDRLAVEQLKRFLIDSGFDAAPLVAAAWEQGELDLLVFGDVEVHTSAVAAPMVTGAGSSSWIERHLGAIELGDANTVDVWSGADVDPVTNLGLGVVGSGGFRVALHFDEPSSQPVAPDALPESPVQEEPSVPAAPSVSSVEKAPPPPPPVSSASPVVSAVEDPPSTPTVLPAVGVPIAAPQPGLVTGERPGSSQPDPFVAARPAPTPPTGFDPDDSDTEAAPPEGIADLLDAQDVAGAASSASRTGLTEASHCGEGHPNPPRGANCYVCGGPLPADEPPDLIEQPAVGRIVFGGGQELSVNRAIMMGRKPDVGETGAHPVVLDHDEVSRSHALVSVDGWTVLLTDQGSRNGTWVSPASDPTPVRLEERVPHVIEHGTTVHLGSPEVSFAYYFDSP